MVGILATVFGSWSCASKPESVTIGLGSSAPGFTPFYVAQSQGFFARNGLELTIKSYASGQAAVQGLINGEVDLAGTTEYPLVGCAFNKNPVSLFTTVNKNESFYLTGRKDRGIQNISDLKGKKIGLTRGTIAEFYLGRFLDLNGLKLTDVSLVNINQTAAPDSISGTTVDAVLVSQPFSYNVGTRLGANGITWPAQSGQFVFQGVAAGNDWIAAHPKLVIQFLKALAQAEDFTNTHPEEAKATQRKLLSDSDAGFLDQSWSLQQFALSLDKSLVLAMEDEARWMIANNLTPEKTVPDVGKYIYRMD